ncbi:MAG TPA: thioesterase family protein [Pyrinomonadaceae bacterium]|jgi:4-hydroxybenzoyl-CoA thioesterase
MPFITRIKVRFGDADPAGLVYYPVIFHYFHIALEEFFPACCGIGYDRLIKDERLGFPTVKSEAEFFVPMIYGDEVNVEVTVSKIGRSSAIFEYRAVRASDGTLCARASNVHVAMNMDTRRAVPIPDKYREAFQSQK